MSDNNEECCGVPLGFSHAPDCPTLTADSGQPMPMYAISEAALDRITDWINCDIEQTENYDEVIALIRAARENGPITDSSDAELEQTCRTLGETMRLKSQMEASLQAFERQRDFLLAQVGSLILRLAGANVAAGLIDLNGASGYVAREQAVINAGLAQIAERNKGDAT